MSRCEVNIWVHSDVFLIHVWVHLCFYLTWFHLSLLHAVHSEVTLCCGWDINIQELTNLRTITGVEAVGKEKQGNTQEKYTGKRNIRWPELASSYWSHVLFFFFFLFENNTHEQINLLPMCRHNISTSLDEKNNLSQWGIKTQKAQTSYKSEFAHDVFWNFLGQ